MLLYHFFRIVGTPIYKLWIGKVEGLENVPKDRNFIIAENHSSYFDVLFTHAVIYPIVKRPIRPIVIGKYWNNTFCAFFLNLGKCIPVYSEKDGTSKEKNKEAINKAIDFLKKGEIIEIFPEGRRNFDGNLSKAKTGIAKIAIRSKKPVLPIGFLNSYEVLPKGKIFPRFIKCDIKIGKPIYLDDYYGKSDDQAYEEVTVKIMKYIGKLIGQEYKY